MRAVDHGRITRRPRNATVGGADHPLAEFGPALVGSQAVSRGLPSLQALGGPRPFVARLFLFRRQEARFVGERREGGCEQCAFSGFEHAGVAVVNGPVDQHSRPGPSLPIAVGGHHLHAAKRADVAFASAGPHQHQLAVAPPRQRRPAVIIVRVGADDLGFKHLDGRGGSGAGREANSRRR